MERTDSRFQVVSTPARAPGCCGICLSVSRGPFVDTGIDDKWNGHVFYICNGCMHDLATDMGLALVPEAEVTEPEPETDSDTFRRGWNAGVRAVKEDFNGLVHRYLGDTDSGPGDSDAAPVASAVRFPEDSEGQEGSGTSADGPTVEGSNAPKRKRPARVSSDSSDGLSELVGDFSLDS